MTWFLLQVKTKQEIRCERLLKETGYGAYCPMTLPDKRKGEKVIDPIPLFPSYLFCQITTGVDDFHPIRKTPGVLRIVSLSMTEHGLEPTKVPDQTIINLRAREDEQGIHDAPHDYQKGDSVRLKHGPLAGYEAIITGTSESRVYALLEYMGTQAMKLDYREIEPA